MGRIVTLDPHQTFEDIEEGQLVKDEKGEHATVAKVLRFAIASELKADTEGQQAEVVERKIKHHSFLSDIRDAVKNGTLIQFTEDEAKYLEGRIAMCFGTLIAAPMIKFLRKYEHPAPILIEKGGDPVVEVKDPQK